MLALCHEKLGTAAFLRPQLVRAYGLASVKHDSQSQAVLLNLLLRNYIKAGLIEAAEKFIKNANAVEKMADSAISVNQQARFLYYWGEQLELPECIAVVQGHNTLSRVLAVAEGLFHENIEISPN